MTAPAMLFQPTPGCHCLSQLYAVRLCALRLSALGLPSTQSPPSYTHVASIPPHTLGRAGGDTGAKNKPPGDNQGG